MIFVSLTNMANLDEYTIIEEVPTNTTDSENINDDFYRHGLDRALKRIAGLVEKNESQQKYIENLIKNCNDLVEKNNKLMEEINLKECTILELKDGKGVKNSNWKPPRDY